MLITVNQRCNKFVTPFPKVFLKVFITKPGAIIQTRKATAGRIRNIKKAV